MTDYIIPNPEGVTWVRWAETMVGFNPTLSNQLWPQLDFKKFGARLCLIVPSAPRPEFFKEWRPWVIALKRALDS